MSRRPRKQLRDPDAPLRVVIYRRVSTDEQGAEGHGLDAQEATLLAEAERKGWEVVASLADPGVSGGKALSQRPAGAEALRMLAAGEADALAVSKLDRLSRSMHDFAGLCEQSQREGWALILLDINVDATTPSGELTSGVLALFAQYERRMASVRTKEGLAAARAKGVRLGRPTLLPAEVVQRIVADRASGLTMTRIADDLTAEGVKTAHGGARWYPSTVRAVLLSQAAAA